jgi:hypothetical protein
MDRFSRELFDMMVASARTMPTLKAQAEDTPTCPSCGGDLSGELDHNGVEDATCGSAHCRGAWYGEVAERR